MGDISLRIINIIYIERYQIRQRIIFSVIKRAMTLCPKVACDRDALNLLFSLPIESIVPFLTLNTRCSVMLVKVYDESSSTDNEMLPLLQMANII